MNAEAPFSPHAAREEGGLGLLALNNGVDSGQAATGGLE